jgi:hypothetical protein
VLFNSTICISIPFYADTSQFDCNTTRLLLITAYSLPIHCLFTAYSLPIHCLFTASRLIYCLIRCSNPCLIHCSLRLVCRSMSLSLHWGHLEAVESSVIVLNCKCARHFSRATCDRHRMIAVMGTLFNSDSGCLFYSLPIHYLFAAYSLPINCLITTYSAHSLPIHCLCTAYTLSILITVSWIRTRIYLT